MFQWLHIVAGPDKSPSGEVNIGLGHQGIERNEKPNKYTVKKSTLYAITSSFEHNIIDNFALGGITNK